MKTKTLLLTLAITGSLAFASALNAHCGSCATDNKESHADSSKGCCPSADADKIKAATAKGEFLDIDHASLKKAMKEGKVVIIDVNGTGRYAKGHIPGALDFEALGKEGLAKKLPGDKTMLVVAYCGGPKCKAYKSGAKAAKDLGYTKVMHYSAGISGWEKPGEAVEPAGS